MAGEELSSVQVLRGSMEALLGRIMREFHFYSGRTGIGKEDG